MTSYPDGMTLRPLLEWPGQLPSAHIGSPFTAPLSATLDELDRELRHLGKHFRNAPSVLEIALRDDDFRMDGMPRASAKTIHPGVVLHVESRFGPLSYPAAKFDTWQDNLRAITLGLNGLRRLDRYGITPGHEQYRGWVAIENHSDVRSRAQALIDSYGGVRAALRATHPDRGGTPEEFQRVQEARRVLRV
ncbi:MULTISPECIES: hypothetical protein [Mycobacteriaceae]|uniref:Molecular chaperone DnaJ n=1 Tax=Mycolicibacterium lutetiense TaxID=1641992 RepID=A0ABS4ZRD0_9MYCO|nr:MULTISPECIES: hypothetical protein [Mycobacteriaceae]MBP2451990.1 hypothetical protein [Mycolicibacterium lutetiense]